MNYSTVTANLQIVSRHSSGETFQTQSVLIFTLWGLINLVKFDGYRLISLATRSTTGFCIPVGYIRAAQMTKNGR